MENRKGKLPAAFEESMRKMLGDEFEQYEAALSRPPYKALRVNTSKISVEDFLKISPFSLTPVPWTKNGFYYDEKKDRPSHHPYYAAGLYYLQEPSAMLPAAQLPVQEGDLVLDLCAAPGGKSTELVSRLGKKGFLVSNDISASREKALIRNLEQFGAENFCVTCETPEKLAEHFPAAFDRILIDAPCSGEGMFRKSGTMISAWEQNGVEKFVRMQREILKEAVRMLRPGGTILYSTCTFEPSEDEEAVEELLQDGKDLQLQVLPVAMSEGFVPGHPEWCQNEDARENPALRRTARLFPHKIQGEGHFVSVVESRLSSEPYFPHLSGKPAVLSKEAEEFLAHIHRTFPRENLRKMKDRLFYVPDLCPDLEGLRVLRSGVFLGEEKKNRFEPSQALSMVLKPEEFDQVIRYQPEDPEVRRYLRGETLSLPEDCHFSSGYVLIALQNFPLGFAKVAGGRLKNKYLPGWRMN